MPEYFWVTEVLPVLVLENGITFILMPGPAFIFTIGNTLLLEVKIFVFLRQSSRIDRYQSVLTIKKTTSVIFINYSATRKHQTIFIGFQGYIKMFPVQKVFTYSVSPVDIPPSGFSWIMLVKEVILTLVIHKAIGIIHPVFRG